MEREGPAAQRIADGCALHDGEPFTAICRQCGTYMCKRCNEDARFDRCPACRAEQAAAAATPSTSAFPFRRDGVVWGPFLRFCFAIYRENFGLLTLAWLAVLVPLFVLNGFGTSLAFGSADFATGELLWLGIGLVEGLWLAIATLGMLEISLRVVRRQPARLSMLTQGAARLPSFLLLGCLSALALGLVQLLAAIPFGLAMATFDDGFTLGGALAFALSALCGVALGGYALMGLVFGGIELAAHPGLGALAALKNAWRIAHGERLTLGFGLFLIGLAWFSGVLLCGIGAVFTLGYASVLFSALYLALRNGASDLEPGR